MRTTPLESWIVDRTGILERSREKLEAYQLVRIREMINHAKKNSIYYKEKLKDLHEDDIKTLKDLQRLPFTFPRDISCNPFDFLCVPQHEVKRIVTLNTSGTTGDGKRIFFTEEDLNLTVDFFKFGMSCLTDNKDRVLVLLPGSSYGSIGDLLQKALSMSKTECVVHGVLTDTEEVAKCIEEKDINCIVGIPLQILYLSRAKRELFKRRIKKVLLSTDYVPSILVQELARYGCSVFTHYGMTEMGYGGGVECEALNGYHMREGDLYFEIVHPDTGKAVENGQYGEVVFTTLNRQAMPLIRYRTGDIASFSSKACSCGTFLNTMNKVLGRLNNRVVLQENQFLYLRELDEIVLSFEEVMDYKASMDTNENLVLELAVQDKEVFRRIEGKAARRIKEALQYKLGYEPEIKVLFNGEGKPTQITNSMIKRKIYDHRKG
ncbi:DVU_1553 family AMP-dependent CoA ligase [Sinanaerobacter chloroacetimidivorans]|uniref:Phenylacetate--CoA ligase family protein n=1 Tax=Sinanaerobacter chloroacetimidivorans TaxID=2818044 RepID=A0A8J7W0M0_9FIRM|nr:AMP-binding protein [Sinanaerobacter chloroacetimidivorans]MBR0597001.1 phenylacetate--CoA ligase family protein [Sinanaerobacter chloroacetimidivorans]